MANGVLFTIDTTELNGAIFKMRALNTKENFRKIMYNAYRRTAQHVRTQMTREMQQEYYGHPSWMRAQIGRAKISAAAMRCEIPVNGVRGDIGRNGEFRASVSGNIRSPYVSSRRKRGPRKIRRKYTITARIVKGADSRLPSKEGGAGGVHFMQFTGRYRGQVWTRLPDGHVRPGVGIGVPQMPTNRAKDAIQRDAVEFLAKRIEHEYEFLMNK